MPDQAQNIQDWATGDAGEGEPALSVSDIRANMEADISQLGTLTYFQADIPDTATGRPNGIFQDYSDMLQYLESGGLVLLDPLTNLPVPNPLITIYANVDPDDGTVEYEVWIDTDTNPI